MVGKEFFLKKKKKVMLWEPPPPKKKKKVKKEEKNHQNIGNVLGKPLDSFKTLYEKRLQTTNANIK